MNFIICPLYQILEIDRGKSEEQEKEEQEQEQEEQEKDPSIIEEYGQSFL